MDCDDPTVFVRSYSLYQFGLCLGQPTKVWNGWVFDGSDFCNWDGSISVPAAGNRDYIHDGGVCLVTRPPFMPMVFDFDVVVGWNS